MRFCILDEAEHEYLRFLLRNILNLNHNMLKRNDSAEEKIVPERTYT